MTRFFSATRHGIPLLALAMLGFGGWSVASKYRPRVVTSPPLGAPASPERLGGARAGNIGPAGGGISFAPEPRGGRPPHPCGGRRPRKARPPPLSIDDRNYRATVAQDEATVASAT